MVNSHAIFSRNRLSLGVFCANTIATLTTSADRFRPTSPECLAVARMADAAGREALVPIARWKGYIDDAAMAQATRQISVFAPTLARENKVPEDSEQMRYMRRTVVLGTGVPLVGCGERIAKTLISLSRAGLDGVVMSYVDFVDGLHRFCRDVLPILAEAGVRQA